MVTLLESSKRYTARAESMHQCGKSLNELQYELEYLIETGKIDDEKLYEIKKSYDEITKDFPENHENIDFHKAIMDRGKHFGRSKLMYGTKITIWSFLEIYATYSVMVVIPILIIFIDYYILG